MDSEHFRHTVCAKRGQRGQSSLEYAIILVFVLMLLVEGEDNSVINQLVNAMKQVFAAYSWMISLPTNFTPL